MEQKERDALKAQDFELLKALTNDLAILRTVRLSGQLIHSYRLESKSTTLGTNFNRLSGKTITRLQGSYSSV